MNNLSISERLELIKVRGRLAQEIREQFGNADLEDLIRHYNRAVKEKRNIKPTTGVAEIMDPLDLKDFSGDLTTVDISGLGDPDISEEVDRSINRENLLASANLYAAYHYDRLGVFEVVNHIYRDFFDGKLRITSEPGALALYRYEKRKKERFRRDKRELVYKRVFNYGNAKQKPDTPINTDFHKLLVSFVTSVAKFYRDQRISEVIRKGAAGLESSFGSLERVRQAGIDLRNSVNRYAYGVTLLFTMEMASYLTECLEILRLPEIHLAYNVKTEWALIEKIGEQKLKKVEKASVRGTVAQEGKEILSWLGGDMVLEEEAIPFEITLNSVGQAAERWLVAHKSLVKP